MHGSRGGGGQGVWTTPTHPPPPPPPLKNHKNIGFLNNTGPDHLKITKLQMYQASVKYRVIISTPAKHHSHGISLVGRCWPAYSVIWILSSKKKKHCKVGPPLAKLSGKTFWIRAWYSYCYKARFFLLVDLRELFFRFRVEGTKKNK